MPIFRAFHASAIPSILQFLPLAHFGTEEAARHRAQVKHPGRAFLYEVELDFRKSLQVPDLSSDIKSGEHHWMRLVDQLHYDVRPKTITSDERNLVFAAGRGGQTLHDRDADACLARVLVGKGIDALAYQNGFEDPGSTSWILMDPMRLKILEVSELAAPAVRRAARP